MTLRTRLALVAAGVVAVVVALASATTYFVMRHELQTQLDSSLKSEALAVRANIAVNPSGGGDLREGDFGGNSVEVVDGAGHVLLQHAGPDQA